MRNTTKLSVIIILLFFTYSCASSNKAASVSQNSVSPAKSEQDKANYWITKPSNNKIIVIGVSSPMLKRDSEIAAAKEDAARKVSLFHGVQGKIETTNRAGSAGFFESVNNINAELIYDTDYNKYIEQLEYDPQRDIVNVDGTIFIRFQYSAAVEPISYVSTKDNKGRPSWTYSRDLPQLNGYITAVGIAQKQRRLKDAIVKSTDAAVAGMIQAASSEVHTSVSDHSGKGATGSIYSVSEAHLEKFLVLEFWIDAETGNVYTLAIGRHVK